jgi:hypothetical protein
MEQPAAIAFAPSLALEIAHVCRVTAPAVCVTQLEHWQVAVAADAV